MFYETCENLVRRLKSKPWLNSPSPAEKKQALVLQKNVQLADRSPAYPYRQLPGTEIRLIRVLPRGSDNSIECQLDQVLISSKPKYFALSYVWGDPSDARTIILEGQTFEVTKNLYEAIYQLREDPDIEYLKDYIWIDAICINQKDIDERSREVPRMVDIYGLSHQTLIWLGPCSPPTSKRSIRKFFQRMPFYTETKSKATRLEKLFVPAGPTADDVVEDILLKSWEFWLSMPEESEDDERVMRSVFGGLYDANLRAWSEILTRPWFSRTWTIQEACVPDDAMFYIGRHSLRFSELREFVFVLAGINKALYKAPGLPRILAVAKVREMRNAILDLENELNPRRMETADVLVRLLRLTGKRQCTDPQDHIYGLLGLLDFLGQDIPADLVPDYSQTYEDLYWKCSAYILGSIGELQLLGFQRNDIKTGPSWVTDFRYLSLRAVPPKRQSSASLSEDRKILFVKGFRIGTYKDHVAACNISAILPHPDRIPKALSDRLQKVEERIINPSTEMRDAAIDETLDGVLGDVRKALEAPEPETCRQTYRRLCNSYGEKSWLAKRRITTAQYTQEYVMAEDFGYPFMLLADGTIARLIRKDVKLAPGDIVCLFQGALQASVIRPCGENYTFISQCRIRTGPLASEEYGESFWETRELAEFSLV